MSQSNTTLVRVDVAAAPAAAPPLAAPPLAAPPLAAPPLAANDPVKFFCVPGIGGNVLHLHALAQRMGGAHRLVALRGGTSREKLPESVEAFAARSVETVLRSQPCGPYMLGGYSGGALIAFEMARQLTAQGHTVGLLALIDTRRPGWRVRPANAPAVAYNFLRNLPGWVRDDLAQSSPRQTLRDVVRHLRRLVGAGPGVQRVIDISIYPAEKQLAMQREYDMLEAYRPQPWDGRITLLRAATQPLMLLHDEAALGWSELAGGGIDIVTLPGNHLTIMREPRVSLLAASLRVCITAAANTPASNSPASNRQADEPVRQHKAA
jgi:thioesterase domain-containing protein